MTQNHTQIQPAGQKGAALIFGLVFLLITTVLTVASMRGSNLQERMTSNLNHQTISFATAERGASEAVHLLTSEHFWNDGPGVRLTTETSLEAQTHSDSGYPLSNGGDTDAKLHRGLTEYLYPDSIGADRSARHFVESAHWNAETGQLDVSITGESLTGDQVSGRSTIRVNISLVLEERTETVFDKGLVAAGNIELEAPITLRGKAHTNADVMTSGHQITLDDTAGFRAGLSAAGRIRGVGDCEIDSDNCLDPEHVTDGAKSLRIPSALEAIACLVDDASLSNGFRHWSPEVEKTFSGYCKVILEEKSFRISRSGMTDIVKPEEIIVLTDCAVELLASAEDSDESIDLLGEVYFCDGDFHAEGSTLRNGTILATGDMVLESATSIDMTEEIDTAFLAGGHITMEGAGTVAGIFWADAGITNADGGTIRGQLMAGGHYPATEGQPHRHGVIRLASAVTVKHVDQIGRFTPRTETLRAGQVTGWAHIN